MDMDGERVDDELLAFLSGVDVDWPPEHAPVVATAANSDSGSSNSSRSDVAAAPVPKDAAPARRPARRLPKDELALLRAQMARLTLQLHALKLSAGIDISTPVAAVPKHATRARPAPADGCLAASSDSLWAKLAAKQQTRRRDAETQLRALREAVETHARRAKRLRQMMLKRMVDERRQLVSAAGKPEMPIAISLPDDERVLLRLAEGMDAACADVDATLRKAKMHALPVPGRSQRAWGLADGAWHVEVRDVHVTPFDLARTERAAWIFLSKPDACISGDEIRKSVRFSYEHPSGVAIPMNQRSVTRRYRERSRVVVLVRSLTQPMPGISVHLSSFLVLTSGQPAVTGPTTVLQSYLLALCSATAKALERVNRTLLVTSRPLADGDAKAERFGLDAWTRAVSRVTDGIDDVLVQGL